MVSNGIFKALSDPTRREIMRLLGKGEMTAGELADRFDMTKPTLSHHFAVLKEADLIRSRREGQRIFYSLNTTVVQDVLAWMLDVFGQHDTEEGSSSWRATTGPSRPGLPQPPSSRR